MNPHVSANWFEIAFPVMMTLILGVQLWRRSQPRDGRLGRVGAVGIILALAVGSAANLFYQRALNVRVWPPVNIFDQVVVTAAGDVFVKMSDPIMGRTNKVQRYNCRGEFRTAFQPDNGGGLFKIAVNPDDTLSIFSVRTDSIDTFKLDGTFLQRREMDNLQMPFKFLNRGPSVLKTNGCEFILDPASGRPAVKDSAGIWPLERGDWVLEYVLDRRNIARAALLGGLMLAIYYIRTRNQRAATKA
ncbi:hypothetical protein [Rhizobium sp. LjRoot254]|uniref:hypothetical protein n=1 Tax=Rhizobium sp. LjRoot254 TaxID=3342297 RepID=UPI003ECDEDFB